MVGLAIQVFWSPVELNILELSRFPCFSFGIFQTGIGLGMMTVTEFDLKLTLGMAERRNTESLPDEESWGGGQRFEYRSYPQSHPFSAVSGPIGHRTG